MLLRAPLPPNAIFVLIVNPKMMQLGVYSQQIWTTWLPLYYGQLCWITKWTILPKWTNLQWTIFCQTGQFCCGTKTDFKIRKTFWQYEYEKHFFDSTKNIEKHFDVSTIDRHTKPKYHGVLSVASHRTNWAKRKLPSKNGKLSCHTARKVNKTLPKRNKNEKYFFSKENKFF